ncbi:MAG: response regulator transcription factor [Chitinophagaceae bacterium]|nr:response regulator transcription factor [Chitinophagaceae bacterium]
MFPILLNTFFSAGRICRCRPGRTSIHLIAEGLTNAEIAEKLFISIPTVNTYRKSLIEKFDAANTAALIGKAIRSGIL